MGQRVRVAVVLGTEIAWGKATPHKAPDMLRLTVISQTQEQAVLKVDGWVSGANVTLLEEEGTRLLQDAERLVLDLSGVRVIDQTGLELVRDWSGDRLVLRGASPFVNKLLAAEGLL